MLLSTSGKGLSPRSIPPPNKRKHGEQEGLVSLTCTFILGEHHIQVQLKFTELEQPDISHSLTQPS